ncbi:MAG: phosphotransferase [Ktedonobacteraceae bacterium]|nr:phosphotransferase [Ktedonobacteraceae bacterium]
MVLSKYPLNDPRHAVFSLVNLLQFLECKSYPAERLLRTIHDATVSIYNDQQLLITTFIKGVIVDYSPETLYKLGATVGKLHALDPLEANTALSLIVPAQMRMESEVAYATKQLVDVSHLVSHKLSKRYTILLESLQAIDVHENLPNMIIHNDCHLGNSVLTQSGQVILLDWEGAGIGSAVLDVGFLLVCCDAMMPWMPSIPIRTFQVESDRLNAVIDGYCQHHRLNATELDRLSDAIRFRSIVFGACRFASVITGRLEDKSLWWETRYEASEKIAEIARRRFEMYLQADLG